jgi:hypothetical protein
MDAALTALETTPCALIQGGEGNGRSRLLLKYKGRHTGRGLRRAAFLADVGTLTL